MIEININLVFVILNLVVFYLLMKKFLFGPILNVVEQRKAMIDQQFASAREKEEAAETIKNQYEASLKSAKEESFRIVDAAKGEAKQQAEQIVKNAGKEADAILEKARADIQAEQDNAMREMEGRVAELAMNAAAKIMGEKSGREQDLLLYDQFIKEAGESHDRNDQ